MKTKFNIGKIEVNGTVVENISIEAEYSVTEVINLVNFGKKFMVDLVEESPELLNSLEKAFNKINEIDNKAEVKEKKQQQSQPNGYIRAIQHNMRAMKKAIQKGDKSFALDGMLETQNLIEKAAMTKDISKELHRVYMNELDEIMRDIHSEY